MSSEEQPLVRATTEVDDGEVAVQPAADAGRSLPTDRAEQLLDDAGERLAAVLRAAGRRLGRVGAARADVGGHREMAQSSPEASTAQHEDTPYAVVQTTRDGAAPADRAEQLLDDIAQRLGGAVHIVGRPLLKFTAQAQEELEDMWVDAQLTRTEAGEHAAAFSEKVGVRTGGFARAWGRRLWDAGATLRDELTDMWAEADREIRERRKDRSTDRPS